MGFKKLRNFLFSEDGVVAIEFVLIAPFMIILFFGLVDLTDMVSYSRRITSVASAVGDLTGQNRGDVSKVAIQDYFKAASLIMNPKPDNSVRVTVFAYRGVIASGGTVPTATLIWKVDNGKGSACTVPDVAKLNSLAIAGNDLIVSQACMQYTPLVTRFGNTFILGSSLFKLEQTIVQRPRSSLTLDCYLVSKVAGSPCPA